MVLTRLSSLFRSKRGLAAALTGVLFAILVYGLGSGPGWQVEAVADYARPIVAFLGTAPGALLCVAVAVILILSGLRTRRPESRRGRAAPPLELARERKRMKLALHEGNRKHQRLRSQLSESERELEQLKSALEEGKRERERLESENEQLRAEKGALEETVSIYDRRVALKQALDAAYRDGLHLRGGTTNSSRRSTTNGGRRTSHRRTFDDEAATKWAIHTSELIKEALGESASRRFLGADGQKFSGDPHTPEEQKQVDGRLYRLSELVQQVDSLQPIELRDSFKDQDRILSR